MAFAEPLTFPWLDMDETFLAPLELLVCSEAEWGQLASPLPLLIQGTQSPYWYLDSLGALTQPHHSRS